MTDATVEREYDPAPGATNRLPVFGWATDVRETLFARLQVLAGLEHDWDTYGGEPIDPAALVVAQRIGERSLVAPLPAPRFYPLPHGGIQVEWNAGPIEVELDIEPDGQLGAFICDDKRTSQRFDGELPQDQGLLDRALQRLAAYR